MGLGDHRRMDELRGRNERGGDKIENKNKNRIGNSSHMKLYRGRGSSSLRSRYPKRGERNQGKGVEGKRNQ